MQQVISLNFASQIFSHATSAISWIPVFQLILSLSLYNIYSTLDIFFYS